MSLTKRDIPKAILWTAPRCRSTVFERSIRKLEGVQVFHEYFAIATIVGEERIYNRYSHREPIPNFKFKDVKEMLEGNFPDRKGVFAKDMACCMIGKMDYLPDGYHHAILIRNPVDALTSHHCAITTGGVPNGADGFPPEKAGFRALWELYEYLKHVKGLVPVVIDSDDILKDPASMMKKYCDVVGFQYTDDMLRWQPENDSEKWTWEFDHFTFEKVWYATLLSSSGFMKPRGTTSTPIDISTLPQYVQTAIKESQPFYEKLYKCRIEP